jgi:uncharacterized protein (TIGR00661 family)
MAKILYGVAGEGMGHAFRSKALIEELSKEHRIKVVASDRGYNLLSEKFDTTKIDYFRIIYRKNKVAHLLTVLNNLARFPVIFLRSRRISGIIKSFKPDIAITDFEPLTDYYAYFSKIPVISIDNMHAITNASHDNIPKKYNFSIWASKLIVNSFVIKADRFFINAFFSCRLTEKNSALIKPLLRNSIFKAKTSDKGHILVYQTSKSNKKLLKEMRNVSQKFIVYGFDEDRQLGNIVMKKTSEKGFLEDLASCKAVITNGGFTLISEALCLKKPILSIPIKNQFEQTLNAIYLEKLGYGMLAEESSADIIKKFIKNIPQYSNKLKNYKKYNNNGAIRKIDAAIRNLTGKTK